MLSEEDKRTALRIAKYTLDSVVLERTKPSYEKIAAKFNPSEALTQEAGVFVTLKAGRGATAKKTLRGCIGYIIGFMPVYKAIVDNALNASTRDPRFDQIAPKELDNICITISVMSPLIKCTPDDVVVGRDGLVLEYEGHRGVYLPQIPGENGWNKLEFLENLCIKAGVSTDKWKDEKSELYRFTAQVFSEDDFPELYKKQEGK